MDDSPADENSPDQASFALSYLFWLIVFVVIGIALWLTSGDLTAFRYAGF